MLNEKYSKVGLYPKKVLKKDKYPEVLKRRV